MREFFLGQRWYSEGEPDLGLGIVSQVKDKQVTLQYPLAGEVRIYNARSSPLKRFQLAIGDELVTITDEKLKISQVEIHNQIIFYKTDANEIVPEMELHPKIELNAPLDRLLTRHVDPHSLYLLRYETHIHHRQYQQSPLKGLFGCSIRLIPHQVYLVQKALKNFPARAMLCDEVGLGKTIEAALILNALIINNLSTKQCIIVPESLCHQWFVELYRKFNLSFTIWDEQTDLDQIDSLILGLSSLKQNLDYFKESLQKYKWDTIIIDESHQNDYEKELSFLKELRHHDLSIILLSATPEVLGVERLFSQLNFLDPFKYHSLSDFNESLGKSKMISEQIKNFNRNDITDPYLSTLPDQEIIDILIDREGMGRSYYRNSRSYLDNKLFKKRIANPIGLKIPAPINDKKVFAAKFEALKELLTKLDTQKLLVIVHAKNLALKIQRKFQEVSNLKIAVFHSDQSLLERDRQAAYFADEEGARILICTEIGSEGRNFEFCHHLYLMDLPKTPDQLEQRIGRLDRIGQKKDIHIHIPFIQHSFEQILFKYYHQVFRSFQKSPRGVANFHQMHKKELNQLLTMPFDTNKTDIFIEKLTHLYCTYEQELETQRDYLIEKNSYNASIAAEIIQSIENFETDYPVAPFMKKVCEEVGIKFDELNQDTVFLEPLENMYLPSFPGLPMEGKSYALKRETCVKNDHLSLLSWESPVAKGAIDLFLNTPTGNCVAAIAPQLPEPIFLEVIYTLQATEDLKYRAQQYLPITPIRVLISGSGEDFTKKISKKMLDHLVSKDLEIIPELPKDIIKELIKKTGAFIIDRETKYKNQALKKIDQVYTQEKQRIERLFFSDEVEKTQLTKLHSDQRLIENSIKKAKPMLDAIRLVLKNN